MAGCRLLAGAALVQPVRQRLQAVVDRRFNRRKLDALSGELLAVIDQTMQPTTASLWLRGPAKAP